jgi:hypothetical protein
MADRARFGSTLTRKRMLLFKICVGIILLLLLLPHLFFLPSFPFFISQEEQRDQEAEKQAMALTAKLEGKNVLQQLFTIVEPTAAETAGPYASKLASDGTPRAAYGQHAAAAAAFTFGGQPASSSSSSSSPHAMTDGRHSDSSAGGGGVPPLGSGVGRGGLALRLQPPPTEAGDDDDGTQVWTAHKQIVLMEGSMFGGWEVHTRSLNAIFSLGVDRILVGIILFENAPRFV